MRPSASLVALASLLPLVAGCLASDRLAEPAGGGAALRDAQPFTLFLCTDGYRLPHQVPLAVDRCNHRVTKPLANASRFEWTTQHGSANEVSVAVNPANPLVAAAGAKDYTVSAISDVRGCGNHTVWMGTYHTRDGGLTWSNDLMPGFPGDPRDGPLRGNQCNTDPVLAFDDDGTLWFSGLSYVGGRDDASGPRLPGMKHDAQTGSQLYFARSDDGGATYQPPAFAAIGDRSTLFNDKQWFALQPGGPHMIATWSQFYTATGPVPSDVPVPAIPGTPADPYVPGDALRYTESFDGGRSWTTGFLLPAGQGLPVNGQFSMPVYLPTPPGTDPVVGVIWADASTVGMPLPAGRGAGRVVYAEGTVTPEGTVFGPILGMFPIHQVQEGPNRDGTGPSRFRISSYPVLAIDTSGGPFNGRRHVVWADQMDGLDHPVRVLARHSDDGVGWSDPVAIADSSRGDQFMPWVATDPDGGVHVAWYDRRNDRDNRLLDVYYAYSADGGASYAPNVRVTERSFDGDLGFHQTGVPFIGDYIGLSPTLESVTIAWADTRHTGTPGRLAGSDVYAATLLRDTNSRATFDKAFG